MKHEKDSFLKIKKNYLKFFKKQEILGQPFYNKIGQLKRFYLPIADSIYISYRSKKKPIIIGLSGSQGSGKTTVAEILGIILKSKFKLNVVYFSIDDFYKTLNQRKKMSKNIHKLFLTRGAPGTHDISLLKKSLFNLLRRDFRSFYMPRFDKSKDDRHPRQKWQKIKKKPDIIIFEGWCVGAKQENSVRLKKPINSLEREEDKELIWRKKVNNNLKGRYKKIFNLINKQIFLKVQNFEYVYKWRLLQEKKLKFFSKGNKIMTKSEIKRFIMYYERITRQMLKDLKYTSDVVIGIDKKHRFNNIKFN